MNIIDYKCVYGAYGASSLEFSSKVAGHIGKGWQPFGGVCVSSCYDSGDDVERLMYAQAMVKYALPKFITGNVDKVE